MSFIQINIKLYDLHLQHKNKTGKTTFVTKETFNVKYKIKKRIDKWSTFENNYLQFFL